MPMKILSDMDQHDLNRDRLSIQIHVQVHISEGLPYCSAQLPGEAPAGLPYVTKGYHLQKR